LDDIFSRYGTTRVCQTDRRTVTGRQQVPRIRIASRGKKTVNLDRNCNKCDTKYDICKWPDALPGLCWKPSLLSQNKCSVYFA